MNLDIDIEKINSQRNNDNRSSEKDQKKKKRSKKVKFVTNKRETKIFNSKSIIIF